ncbi:MAG TPA: EF-hand domain-containing protein [Candidatus Sumerlaeota bacterium]|nr:EF-hand domain-containing protein [Candidatus Sumerlaeota bacterium]
MTSTVRKGLLAVVLGGLMAAGGVWHGAWGRMASRVQAPAAEEGTAAGQEETPAPPAAERGAAGNPLAGLVEGDVEGANGVITQFRFLNAAREAFEKLDADGNGQLEGEEVLALREALGLRNRKAEALFKQMDANGDERISRYEYKGEEEEFARLDENGDGLVTLSEMIKGKTSAPVKTVAPAKPKVESESVLPDDLFKEWDLDGDGQLTPTEFKGSREVFDRLDKNGDGVLSSAELRPVAPAKAVPAKPTTAKESGAEEPKAADAVPAAAKGGAPGAIAREEFKGPQSLFDQIDANKDGFLAPEELDAYRQSLLGGKAK